MIQHFSSNTFKIFFLVFFSFLFFTDFSSSTWHKPVTSALASHQTSHVPCTLGVGWFPVWPKPETLFSSPSTFLQLLLMDPLPSLSSCCDEAAGALPRHGRGGGGGATAASTACYYWNLLIFTFSRNGPRLGPPSTRRRWTPTGTTSEAVLKKCKKMYFLHPDEEKKD